MCVWNDYDGDSETVNELVRHTALKRRIATEIRWHRNMPYYYCFCWCSNVFDVVCKQLMRCMSSTDTPLNTVHLLQEKQKADKLPYIVLSGGKGIAAYVSIYTKYFGAMNHSWHYLIESTSVALIAWIDRYLIQLTESDTISNKVKQSHSRLMSVGLGADPGFLAVSP